MTTWNKTNIEEYFVELKRGHIVAALSSENRKRLFGHLINTSPEFSSKQFHEHGLKGTFGLSNFHREQISISIKSSWAKRKEIKNGQKQLA